MDNVGEELVRAKSLDMEKWGNIIFETLAGKLGASVFKPTEASAGRTFLEKIGARRGANQ